MAFREWQRSPSYSDPFADLNVGRNNSNFEVGRHERINRKITFGQNPNQSYHTWRHINRAGFNRWDIESAIRKDLALRDLANLSTGRHYNFIIRLNGQSFQYTIYRINENKYNIGRIHPAGGNQ